MRMITLKPTIQSVETQNGVALSVSGVAQVVGLCCLTELGHEWPIIHELSAIICFYSDPFVKIPSL